MRIETNLSKTLLIASPMLDDPVFNHTVVYLHEYNKEGALGVIINQPLSLKLKKILKHLDIKTDIPEIAEQEVLMGGPSGQENGFVLHHDPAQNGALTIDSSKEILHEISKEPTRFPFLITLGYSSWAKGQLEDELANDDWIIAPLDERILFEIPYEQRWLSAGKLIGIDLNNFSSISGNA